MVGRSIVSSNKPLTKYIAPEGWTFAPLSLKVVWDPPLLFHFLGLHILNYKCTNFYQNLSAGSIWWNDVKGQLGVFLRF